MDFRNNFMTIEPTGIEPASGTLLISTPFFNDTAFNHSVVVLLEHSSKGTVGLIINKRTNIQIQVAKPSWNIPGKLSFGGPVLVDSILALHNFADDDKFSKINENLYCGMDETLLSVIEYDAIKTLKHRFFIGYSGWSEGQLNHEIEQGMWVVADYMPELIFDTHFTKIWQKAVWNLGEKYHHWLDIPEDIILN